MKELSGTTLAVSGNVTSSSDMGQFLQSANRWHLFIVPMREERENEKDRSESKHEKTNKGSEEQLSERAKGFRCTWHSRRKVEPRARGWRGGESHHTGSSPAGFHGCNYFPRICLGIVHLCRAQVRLAVVTTNCKQVASQCGQSNSTPAYIHLLHKLPGVPDGVIPVCSRTTLEAYMSRGGDYMCTQKWERKSEALQTIRLPWFPPRTVNQIVLLLQFKRGKNIADFIGIR